LAHLAVAGFLWGESFPTKGLGQVSLPLAPSFEENASVNNSIRYVWRKSQVLAGFGNGGAVSIRFGGEANAQISFVGANGRSEPRGECKSQRKSYYYVGISHNWHADEHFDCVRYPEIYPGIDLVFVTSQGQLEYNFEVAPGADPSVIRIRYDGLTPSLVRGGNLEVGEGSFKIVQLRPQAFQPGQNHLLRIHCHYRVTGHEVSIELASHNKEAPLVIDPILVFSTYLGGSGLDAIYGVATDAAGNLYVTGETSSGNLTNPVVPARPYFDAFVAKLNSTATQVLWIVYLGGSGDSSGKAIAVDASGDVYATGATACPNFPVTTGALSATAPGPEDAFVAKLSTSGNLQYSTYLGGTKSDFGFSIAVDAVGAAYVTGQAESPTFPVTTGAFQTVNHGGISDCFVSKLNAMGSALVYSTLLGGSALDLCSGIAVDASGAAYVTGTTYSTDFPLQAALQGSLLGTANGFLTKINPAGTGLVYSTYLGGSGTDNGNAIGVDSSGNAYVAGTTSSIDFPASAGAWQTALYGLYNAFALKVSPNGSTLVYSTLLGGSGSDTAVSLSVDQAGRAILAGYTNSPDFPVARPLQSTASGSFDAFISVLDPTGASLIFSSYLGGTGDDRAYAVLAAPGDSLYLAGTSASSNFPTANAIQTSLSAGYDAFIAELNYVNFGPPAPVSVTPASGSGSSRTFALAFSDAAGASDILSAQIIINSSLARASGCSLYFYAGGANVVYLANDAGTFQSSLSIGGSGTMQNSQCAVNAGASSVALSGNTLTLNLALSFTPAFAGTQNVYMYVQNATLGSGWAQNGTWTVP
jgi:beta-propeller repeat-containing protein